MSEIIVAAAGKAKEGLMFWKLAILKALLSACVQSITVFLVAVQTVEWSSLTTFNQWCIILGAMSAGFKDILSFLSTTMSDLRAEAAAPMNPPTDGPTPIP